MKKKKAPKKPNAEWVTYNVGLGLNKHPKHQWGKKFKRPGKDGWYRACKTYGCCAWQMLRMRDRSFMEQLLSKPDGSDGIDLIGINSH
jgi:hypothetical protein